VGLWVTIWSRWPPLGEHEVLWGRLVRGRRYTVSGQTKQGCGAPSFAKAHSIQTRAAGSFSSYGDSAAQDLAAREQSHDLAAGSGASQPNAAGAAWGQRKICS
jgi:hypothetical protein